jgi:hypothetical protein
VPPEEICRAVYEETCAFYLKMEPALGSAARGFRILAGPPIVNAPLLSIGFQPGGEEHGRFSHLDERGGWPTEAEYQEAQWPLANRSREVLGHPGPHLNLIFFRAPSISSWRSGVTRTLRRDIEDFCYAQVERIVRALKPQHIVLIGLGTFAELIENGVVSLQGRSGRVLVRSGSLWGRPADGVIHLTGARNSRADRDKLIDHFSRFQVDSAA